MRFHAALVASCPNQYLLDLIRVGRQAGQRYEFAFLHEVVDTEESAHQHEQVIAALERQDLDAALEHLNANWQRTIDELTRCLTAATSA